MLRISADKRRFSFALIGVFLIAVIAIMPFISKREMHLSAYSDSWNDLSEFRKNLELKGYKIKCITSTPLSLREYNGDYNKTLLCIIGVERPYTNDEIASIINFVDRGGSLIVADDFGFGNRLIKVFGVEFSRCRLWSPNFIKNPSFPVINVTYEGIHYEVMMNEPSTLSGVSEKEILVETDSNCWLDANKNGKRDLDELSDIYPIVASTHYGEGEIIIISDPGIFINDCWNIKDNSFFVMALVKSLVPSESTIIFDESIHVHKMPNHNFVQVMFFVLCNLMLYPAGKVVLLGAAIVLIAPYMRKIKRPVIWFHRDILTHATYHHLKIPELKDEDVLRMKHIAEEKVRLALVLSKDEFANIDESILKSVVGDDLLYDFITNWEKYSVEDLPKIIKKMDEWVKR